MRASRGMAAMPGRLTADHLAPRGRGALSQSDACYRFVMGLWWDGPRRGGMLDLATRRKAGWGADPASETALRVRPPAPGGPQTDDARPAARATSASSSSAAPAPAAAGCSAVSCWTRDQSRLRSRDAGLVPGAVRITWRAAPGQQPGPLGLVGGHRRGDLGERRSGGQAVGPQQRRERGSEVVDARGIAVGQPPAPEVPPGHGRGPEVPRPLEGVDRLAQRLQRPLLAHPALVLRQLRARRGPGSLGPRP